MLCRNQVPTKVMNVLQYPLAFPFLPKVVSMGGDLGNTADAQGYPRILPPPNGALPWRLDNEVIGIQVPQVGSDFQQPSDIPCPATLLAHLLPVIAVCACNR